MKRMISIVLATAVLLLLPSGCAQTVTPLTRTAVLLDTVVTVSLYDAQSEELLDACMAHIEEREALWSRTVEGSDVARLNAAAGEDTEVAADTATLLLTAQTYAMLTDGAFDVTVAPLTDLWEQSTDSGILPSEEDRSRALSHCGIDKLIVSGQTARLSEAGAAVDLGGIAKGQIADELAALLQEAGCTSAIIDLGGNIYALGSRPNGQPFRVAIADPQDEDSVIGTVAVSGGSVVTSGSYERQYFIGGQGYSHILDPQTGLPVENDLLSVTILSPQSVDGDALSTACFVMGYEKARAFVDSYPDIEAIFVKSDGSVVATDGVEWA